ncbi:MAG: hypothetical protein AAB459_03520 [Patescibacteria group bacterium]
MSIDIEGFDPRDRGATNEVTYHAGRLCVAQGIHADQAYTIGDIGATYASEFTFATLRRMEIIPDEGIDLDLFKRTARALMQQSGVDV